MLDNFFHFILISQDSLNYFRECVFYVNFTINLSVSIKSLAETSIGIALNLYINLRRIDVFTMSSTLSMNAVYKFISVFFKLTFYHF